MDNSIPDRYQQKVGNRFVAWGHQLEQSLGPARITGLKIFAVTFAAIFLVGLLWLMQIPPKFTATAQLAPQAAPESSTSGNLGVGLTGGLSSLLGTKNQPTNLTAFQTLLGTASFSSYLIYHDHLDQLIFPKGVHHSILSVVIHTLLGQHVSNIVTPADMQEYLQSNVYLQPDEIWGYLKLSYTNPHRDASIKVLQTIIVSGDRVLRQREAISLDQQIHYLSRVTTSTTDIEQQNVFRRLLGEKLASKVLIDTQETYAFKIFDAPYAPATPNSPNAALLLLLLILVALLGAATVTAGLWWYSNPSR